MARNYARALVMFKPAPGKAGPRAGAATWPTDLGKSSDGGKTWTYTIQKGLKFEDGIADHHQGHRLRASRARSTRAVLKQGPSYFDDLLNWPKDYKGPFKGPKDADISSAIETPDDSTIVFHLKQPFAEFDYLAQLPQTAPVPAAKDTGKKYTTHPISSGPYMWQGNYRHRHGRHAGAQPQLGRRDRPQPQGAAGPDRREARPAGRRPGQPDHLR